MAFIGETTCQPIGDCGTGTYGQIQDTANTLYVNQSYHGSDSDGTKGRPFTTITAALQAAAAGSHVAIAAGDYAEDLWVGKPVTLAGRCAQMVSITGLGIDNQATVMLAANGSTLRGVTLHGPREGVWVLAQEITIEDVDVAGCDRMGVFLIDGAALLLRRSLVRGNIGAGIYLDGGEATLQNVVVRDTLSPEGYHVAGILSEKATVTVRDSVIEDNRHDGIAIADSDLDVARSVIQRTRGIVGLDDSRGDAIVVRQSARRSGLVVVDSLVADNQGVGIYGDDADLSIERTVVCDSMGVHAYDSSLQVKDSAFVDNSGVGFYIDGGDGEIAGSIIEGTRPLPELEDVSVAVQALHADVGLYDSLLLNNDTVGVAVLGARLHLSRSRIKDTLPNSISDFGVGMMILRDEAPSVVAVDACQLEGNHSASLWMQSSELSVERSVIQGTRPGHISSYGDGIQVNISYYGDTAFLTLKDSLLEGNARAGLLLADAGGEVVRSVFRGSILPIALEDGADPELDESNVFEDNETNEVSYGLGLQVAPPPTIPTY